LEGAEEALKKDLAEVNRAVLKAATPLIASHHASEVVRLLHPRGKANEQEFRRLRLAEEEDAELAVHIVGFLLREVGWAV